MPSRSVETPSGILTLDEEIGFVRVKNKKRVEQTLADARKNIGSLKELMGDKRYPVLVDLEGSSLSREVRNYYGGAEVRKLMPALALLVTNPVASVLANLFFAMTSQQTPTRLFNSEHDAIEWLRSFKASK